MAASSQVQLSGFRELDRKLARMAKALPKQEQERILEAGAEIVAEEMRVLVSVDEGDLKGSIQVTVGRRTFGQFSLARFLGADAITVQVGPTRGGEPDGYHAHFVELGTLNMPAQPFIRPAFDNTEGQATQRIASEVTQAIARAAG